MTTWILVLTLIATDHRGGMSVTSTPPFRDHASCMAAAKTWLNQTRGRGRQTATALCAKA